VKVGEIIIIMKERMNKNYIPQREKLELEGREKEKWRNK
jgi:hypothetical protein